MEYLIVLVIITIFSLSIVAYQRFKKNIAHEREISATTEGNSEELLQIKKKRLQELRKLIHTTPDGTYSPETRTINVSEDLHSATILTLGMVGGGAYGVGESYYNLNQAFSENEEFTSVMESRYNNVFENADRNTWLSKLEDLNKEETIKANYISNFAGYKAELLGIEKLESLGFEVQQFEARNHPDNDLLAISPSGETIEISVKNYENVNYLKRAVIEHPESKNYLINTEIYNKIQSNPELEEWFSSRGIQLFDGEYTNAELRQTAQESIEAFSDMKGSVGEELADGAIEGILDSIPLTTLVLLGYKIKKIKRSFKMAGNLYMKIGLIIMVIQQLVLVKG